MFCERAKESTVARRTKCKMGGISVGSNVGGGKGGKTTNKRLEEVEEEGREEMNLKHFLR